MGGSLPREMFQDAVTYEQSGVEESWLEWPLVATDGDAVALLELLSEEKVEISIDSAALQDAIRNVDWSSRKAGSSLVPQPLVYEINGLNQQMTITSRRCYKYDCSNNPP